MSALFAAQLLGWKKLEKTGNIVPNSADSSSSPSRNLAGEILDSLGLEPGVALPETPKNPGPELERAVHEHLETALSAADPSRAWQVNHSRTISHFSQYAHLGKLKQAVPEKSRPERRPGLRLPDQTRCNCGHHQRFA
ncbi:NgoMIV family type II restriction endonuclease [Streptomyces sp. NPDC002545]